MSPTDLESRLANALANDGRAAGERERLVRLMHLFAELAPPPDPLGLHPRYSELKDRYLRAIEIGEGEALEEAFLILYCHVHGHEAPYTPDERRRVDETGGYWSHAGGLSPILKAAPHLAPDAVSADFGAGDGLQSLLMQKLHPHARSVQIEISSRMVEAGRNLQQWLGIEEERVEWRIADVCECEPSGFDFIYLYRPVRPEGGGLRFYERFSAALEIETRSVVIFSIADCLRPFLSPRFEVFYTDGHLTCYRGPLGSG